MGDFTGFKFGNWHSSDPETGKVTVIRTSNGDRYEEQLHPEINDITAEVPGVDGSYYFGSKYGNKTIDIEIAFDSLTEFEFRKLRQAFGTKQIKELIFDELPYKKYLAKIENPIELSYVCFDEPKKTLGEKRDGVRIKNRTTRTDSITIDGAEVGDEEALVGTAVAGGTIEHTVVEIEREQVTPYEYDYTETERIYKGEGKISFVCYFPFAKSVYKVLPFVYQKTTDENIKQNKKYFVIENDKYELVDNPSDEYIDTYYERIDVKADWVSSSGILSINNYDGFVDTYNNGSIITYNAGDLPVGFRLYLPAVVAESATSIIYKQDGPEGSETARLQLKAMTMKDNDPGVLIDTNNGLILGANAISDTSGNIQYITTGNLYNEFIEAGYFFHLEPNFVINDRSIIVIEGGGNNILINYDYLYF